jgi:hypothetical protein
LKHPPPAPQLEPTIAKGPRALELQRMMGPRPRALGLEWKGGRQALHRLPTPKPGPTLSLRSTLWRGGAPGIVGH